MTRIILSLTLVLFFASPAAAFVRGDANDSGAIEVGDAIRILSALFNPGVTALSCEDAADCNDDGTLNISDPIYLISVLFNPTGPQMPAPHPGDGIDPTPDTLVDCAPQGVLATTTISQGDQSNHSTGTLEVIRSSTNWDTFWIGHSTDPIPPVDFSQEMVIIVLHHFKSGGISSSVDIVEETATELLIHHTTIMPGVHFPVTIYPHHIVRTAISNNTPVFIENIIALP